MERNGYSLAELSIVIAVIMIAVVIGVPSLTTFLAAENLSVASRNVATMLQSARFLAVSRDEPILVDFVNRTSYLDAGASVTYTPASARSIRIATLDGTSLKGLGSEGLAGAAFAVIPGSGTARIRFTSRGTLGNSTTADAQVRLSNRSGTIDVFVTRGGRVWVRDNRAS